MEPGSSSSSSPREEEEEPRHHNMIKVISRHQGMERVRFVRNGKDLESLLLQLFTVPDIDIEVKDNNSSPRVKRDYGKLRLDKDGKEWY